MTNFYDEFKTGDAVYIRHNNYGLITFSKGMIVEITPKRIITVQVGDLTYVFNSGCYCFANEVVSNIIDESKLSDLDEAIAFYKKMNMRKQADACKPDTKMRHEKEIIAKWDMAVADAEYYHSIANMIRDRYLKDNSAHHSVRRSRYRLWESANKRCAIAINRAQLFNQLLA